MSRWKKVWMGVEVVVSRVWGIGRVGLEGVVWEYGGKLVYVIVRGFLLI